MGGCLAVSGACFSIRSRLKADASSESFPIRIQWHRAQKLDRARYVEEPKSIVYCSRKTSRQSRHHRYIQIPGLVAFKQSIHCLTALELVPMIFRLSVLRFLAFFEFLKCFKFALILGPFLSCRYCVTTAS